ncbi:hypothetical protein [Mycobacterium sp. URHB0021]
MHQQFACLPGELAGLKIDEVKFFLNAECPHGAPFLSGDGSGMEYLPDRQPVNIRSRILSVTGFELRVQPLA